MAIRSTSRVLKASTCVNQCHQGTRRVLKAKSERRQRKFVPSHEVIQKMSGDQNCPGQLKRLDTLPSLDTLL